MPDLPRRTANPRACIDPRGPRFGAALTATLLLVTLFLALTGRTAASTALLTAIALLFAWGAFAGIRRHPFGHLYASLLRPRLAPPAELEESRAAERRKCRKPLSGVL